MSVGTVVTLKAGVVVMRQPVWPFPEPGEFPRELGDGKIQCFYPIPYHYFPLHQPIPQAVLDLIAKKERKD